MKKAILVSFVVGIAVMFSSWGIAQALGPPTGLVCSLADTDGDLVNDAVCCYWDPVEDAEKYSLDIDVAVDTDEDGVADMTVEFSFGTSDRTDGGLMSDPNLCVPLEEFVYDIDGDGVPDQLSGEAIAKVKALDPGHGKGRQNHPFSAPYDFTLP